MRGGRGWGVVCVLASLVLGGCDRPIRAEPPIRKLSALEFAVHNTRVEGSARTTTTLPEGMLPTIRVSGVLDFRAERSDTLLETEKDGRRVHYQRLVRGPEGVFLGRYLGADQSEPRWQRMGEAAEAPWSGAHWDGITMLGAIEVQHAHFAPAGEHGRRFERVQPPPTHRPGLWVHLVELDERGRVERVEFELTSMEGRFALTYFDYGDARPVEVPEL